MIERVMWKVKKEKIIIKRNDVDKIRWEKKKFKEIIKGGVVERNKIMKNIIKKKEKIKERKKNE